VVENGGRAPGLAGAVTRWHAVALAGFLFLGPGPDLSAQSARIRDLTIAEGEVPVRLVGYGLVIGLSNTGDRVFGGDQGGMTVRSVANLLRNMGVEVPERVIRTRNAAAVLVTSEASPYTRRGGRFDVSVASLGDATSLRGGVLWTTPLFASLGGQPVASAQGNLVFPVGDGRLTSVETSTVLSGAGVALLDLGASIAVDPPGRLLLREPDLGTAQRIADAVNTELGDGSATVEDPGSVRLELPPDAPLQTLATLQDLRVLPSETAVVVIDARSGAVAAGGSIELGAAVVSHDWLTLTIRDPEPLTANGLAAPPPDEAGLAPGAVRADTGVRVQELAEALHAVGATADVISAVFQSLRRVGALRAQVVLQ